MKRKQSTRASQAQVRRQRILAQLADGQFHSGQRLAARLRISRAAVWKLIKSLQAIGIPIESLSRQGYRLPRAVDLLDKTAITAALESSKETVSRLDVLLEVDSTNRYLIDNPMIQPGKAQVCVAELQTAGRGRRGRSWLAPFGSGVCFSLSWQFDDAPPTFSALGLAVGVAAVEALRRCGLEGVALKWPNDLVWEHRKLGGILIEMRGETGGPSHVVIGIGINMQMPADARLALAERQATLVADIRELLRERTPTRNRLVAALMDEIIRMLEAFAVSGFAAFVARWRSLDALADAPVRVISGAETIWGVARGVDADGSLLIDSEGQIRRFVSGEVSLRRQ
jgi:BirA family biotin operon repressor/biotin-[acetyl-CoA-carboxylase] ligase